MKKVIIREEVSITQKEVDEVIKDYKKMSETFKLCINCKVLDKKGIIKEIRKLTETGKHILLMRYRYKKFQKEWCKIKMKGDE